MTQQNKRIGLWQSHMANKTYEKDANITIIREM